MLPSVTKVLIIHNLYTVFVQIILLGGRVSYKSTFARKVDPYFLLKFQGYISQNSSQGYRIQHADKFCTLPIHLLHPRIFFSAPNGMYFR